MRVSERMTKNLVTVSSSSNASEAAKKMRAENVGTVLVVDNGSLKGIITDRQIATKVVAEGKGCCEGQGKRYHDKESDNWKP